MVLASLFAASGSVISAIYESPFEPESNRNPGRLQVVAWGCVGMQGKKKGGELPSLWLSSQK
jgi:hypothetical protein